jgi:hypothetical protein
LFEKYGAKMEIQKVLVKYDGELFKDHQYEIKELGKVLNLLVNYLNLQTKP